MSKQLVIAVFVALLVVPARMATAQDAVDSGKAVQPKVVRPAERYQAQVVKNDAALRAAVGQNPAQELVKPMNQTARAYLESQPKGLTPVAMICLYCGFGDR